MIIKRLPNDRPSQIVIDQIVRSASSIGANISEGYGRYRGKEYIRFIRIALGSANETEYWLLVLSEIHPSLKSEFDRIIQLNKETIAMLVSAIRKLEV